MVVVTDKGERYNLGIFEHSDEIKEGDIVWVRFDHFFYNAIGISSEIE